MYLVNNKIQKSITLFFLSHTLCINKYIFLFTFFSSIHIAVHDTLNCAKLGNVFLKSVGTLCRNFDTKEKMSKIMRGEKGWGAPYVFSIPFTRNKHFWRFSQKQYYKFLCFHRLKM